MQLATLNGQSRPRSATRRAVLMGCLAAVLTTGACASTGSEQTIDSNSEDLVVGPQVIAALPLSAGDLPAVPNQTFLRATHTLAAAD